MTYIAALHPDRPSIDADEARVEWFDENMPEWEIREGMGDRFVSASDMPAAPVPVRDMPTVADWEAYAEANWSDPAERSY
jgi:hypothetical protein